MKNRKNLSKIEIDYLLLHIEKYHKCCEGHKEWKIYGSLHKLFNDDSTTAIFMVVAKCDNCKKIIHFSARDLLISEEKSEYEEINDF